jgi:hypothetical protein
MPEVSKVVDLSGTDDAARLPALVEELIKTERSYISRIMTLKTVSYVMPCFGAELTRRHTRIH